MRCNGFSHLWPVANQSCSLLKVEWNDQHHHYADGCEAQGQTRCHASVDRVHITENNRFLVWCSSTPRCQAGVS